MLALHINRRSDSRIFSPISDPFDKKGLGNVVLRWLGHFSPPTFGGP